LFVRNRTSAHLPRLPMFSLIRLIITFLLNGIEINYAITPIQPCCSLTTASHQSKFTYPECSSFLNICESRTPSGSLWVDPYEDYETLKRVELNNNRISNRNVWENPVKSLYHMHGPYRANGPRSDNPCLKL